MSENFEIHLRGTKHDLEILKAEIEEHYPEENVEFGQMQPLPVNPFDRSAHRQIELFEMVITTFVTAVATGAGQELGKSVIKKILSLKKEKNLDNLEASSSIELDDEED